MLFSWSSPNPTSVRIIVAILALLFVHSYAAAADNWRQVNTDGFLYPVNRSDDGTRLHQFNNQLYASNSDGVFLMNDPVTRSWTQLTIPGSPLGPGSSANLIGVIGDYFYAESGGNLWWIQTGSALNSNNWQQVASSPLITPIPIARFGSALYASVMVTTTGPFEVWRTTDIGSTTMNWSRVVENSFGDPANNQWISIAQVYKDELYIGTSTLDGIFGDPAAYNDGVEVWRSDSGNLGDWVQVNVDGFGTLFDGCIGATCNFPIHQVIGSAVVYSSRWDGAERLYVGTKSHYGAEVWSYNGSSWSNETPPWAGPCFIGCGPGRNESMQVYRGHLYLAEGFPTANLAKFDGRNWYIEEDGPFPFDPGNVRLWEQAVHEGHLYVTTHTSVLAGEEHGDQVWGFFPPDRYVNALSGVDAGDCSNAMQPCESIQYALDQSSNGELIKVAQGYYNENIVVDSQMMAVTLEGGWGDNFTTRIDDPVTTWISGSPEGRVLFLSGVGKNIQLRLSGILMSEGSILVTGGGAIYALADNGRVTLELDRMVIRDSAAPAGGGLFLDAKNDASLLYQMERSIVTSNAGVSGGAIYTATATGASSRLNITNSFVTENFAFIDGGGLAGYSSGGGQAELLLSFNTFTGNDADNLGGGIYLWAQDNGSILSGLTGGIVWGNKGGADNHSEDIYLTQSAVNGSLSLFGEHSDIGVISDPLGLYDDRGSNTSSDPFFIDFRSGYYFLSDASPVIDAAACGVLISTPPIGFECLRTAPYLDYSGDDRPSSCVIQCDMGADEYVPLVLTDTRNCELQDVYISSGNITGSESCQSANLIEVTNMEISATGYFLMSVLRDTNVIGHIRFGPGFHVAPGGRLQADVLACTPYQTYVAGLGCLP